MTAHEQLRAVRYRGIETILLPCDFPTIQWATLYDRLTGILYA